MSNKISNKNRLRELGPGVGAEEAREAIAKEMNKPRGTPRGRESQSQKAQLGNVHKHGTNKGLKVPMQDKTH